MPHYVDTSSLLSEALLVFVIFIVILLSWVLVDLWGRWFNNLMFSTFGLNPESSLDTFFIAIFMTMLIIACIFFLKSVDVPYQDEIRKSYSDSNIEDLEKYMLIGIEPQQNIEMIPFISSF